jgi:hypothetical protein
MKLITTMAILAGTAMAKQSLSKCAQIPKGGKRRYSPPRTIERGDNQPAAIEFLTDSRADLMTVFAYGKREMGELGDLVSNEMALLGKFADATQDQFLGQIFRAAKQQFNQITLDGQDFVKSKYGEEMYKVYRDNTQRIAKVVRDVTYTPSIIQKIYTGEYIVDDVRAAAMRFPDDASEVYKVFLDNHLETFIEPLKDIVGDMERIHREIKKQVMKVLDSEKQKTSYRQLVNELPLVYQFFNDNIDYIELQNVDKDLAEAVSGDILHTLAEQSGDKQVASMINRNMKFIKNLMTGRAMRQQEDKVLQKVMGKNKELKAAIANEAEFNRLAAEAEKAGKEMTKEMESKIWDQAKKNVQKKQQEQIGNQQENLDKTKHEPKKGLTRYEHVAAIMNLMPDELEQSISEMVKQSCPELDLTRIEEEEMKQTLEEQPEAFIDQLIKELHDVCDMFGLIDETKVIKQVINGVEVEIYAADWFNGEKKEW